MTSMGEGREKERKRREGKGRERKKKEREGKGREVSPCKKPRRLTKKKHERNSGWLQNFGSTRVK